MLQRSWWKERPFRHFQNTLFTRIYLKNNLFRAINVFVLESIVAWSSYDIIDRWFITFWRQNYNILIKLSRNCYLRSNYATKRRLSLSSITIDCNICCTSYQRKLLTLPNYVIMCAVLFTFDWSDRVKQNIAYIRSKKKTSVYPVCTIPSTLRYFYWEFHGRGVGCISCNCVSKRMKSHLVCINSQWSDFKRVVSFVN